MAASQIVTPARLAYSFDEIAGPILPVSARTLKRAAESGDLKTFKLRGRRLVRAEDLRHYLDSLTGGDAR